MRPALSAVLLSLAMGAAACRPPPTGTLVDFPVSADGGANANSLGPSDLLEVRVYGETDLSGIYRVTPDGVLDFPLCGKVKVGGHSATDAADQLTECLKNGFLKRPQVSVMVKEFNSKKVFVFGDVAKPGTFSFEQGMTIVHAVSLAGGFTRTAAKNYVTITRVVDGREVKLPVRAEDIVQGREKNLAILPGDIIFVPEGFF
jgi:polysaccharide export outer membrane protein